MGNAQGTPGGSQGREQEYDAEGNDGHPLEYAERTRRKQQPVFRIQCVSHHCGTGCESRKVHDAYSRHVHS
jgi:hypothetical protein